MNKTLSQNRLAPLFSLLLIVFTSIATVILAYIPKFICRGLREKDEVLEIGDVAIHGEEVYPQETFSERVSAMSSTQRSLPSPSDEVTAINAALRRLSVSGSLAAQHSPTELMPARRIGSLQLPTPSPGG